MFTEADGGAEPWYLTGFAFVQDTPLGATNAREFRCTRHRGDANSPLLMVNHWIDSFPPPPGANERVGEELLRRRLERCAAERRLRPSLVAVDYYNTSGVVAIAAEWNRRAVR